MKTVNSRVVSKLVERRIATTAKAPIICIYQKLASVWLTIDNFFFCTAIMSSSKDTGDVVLSLLAAVYSTYSALDLPPRIS